MSLICEGDFGRSGGIRTHDPQSPRLVRYQTAPRSAKLRRTSRAKRLLYSLGGMTWQCRLFLRGFALLHRLLGIADKCPEIAHFFQYFTKLLAAIGIEAAASTATN